MTVIPDAVSFWLSEADNGVALQAEVGQLGRHGSVEVLMHQDGYQRSEELSLRGVLACHDERDDACGRDAHERVGHETRCAIRLARTICHAVMVHRAADIIRAKRCAILREAGPDGLAMAIDYLDGPAAGPYEQAHELCRPSEVGLTAVTTCAAACPDPPAQSAHNRGRLRSPGGCASGA